MDCINLSCPHRDPVDDQCSLVVPGHRDGSLVVVSLELGRELADHGRARFRSSGTCMFPCIRPGDLLTIESCTVDQVAPGEILVFRQGHSLFAHRVIDRGVHEGRTFVLTRPDRAREGEDGPLYSDDILGVVSSIRRNRVEQPLQQQALRGPALLQAAVLEWGLLKVRPRMITGLAVLRNRAFYHRVKRWWIDGIYRERTYVVRVPLGPRQSHDLYRTFDADQFDPRQSRWHGAPAPRWHLDLFVDDGKTLAGTATIIWHPPGCPRGTGWRVVDIRMRSGFLGAGLETALRTEGERILTRCGLVQADDGSALKTSRRFSNSVTESS